MNSEYRRAGFLLKIAASKIPRSFFLFSESFCILEIRRSTSSSLSHTRFVRISGVAVNPEESERQISSISGTSVSFLGIGISAASETARIAQTSFSIPSR